MIRSLALALFCMGWALLALPLQILGLLLSRIDEARAERVFDLVDAPLIWAKRQA